MACSPWPGHLALRVALQRQPYCLGLTEMAYILLRR